MNTNNGTETKSTKLIWLIYIALLISGIILIGDALNISAISKLTTRLGVGLVYSALALIFSKNRPYGIIGVGIVWVAIIITFFR
jgi:hypothetical protein